MLERINNNMNPFGKIINEIQAIEKSFFRNNPIIENPVNSKELPSFPIKLKEDENKYELVAEVPGVKKDNIEVVYDKDHKTLTVRIEKKEEQIKKDEKVHFSYVSYGSFEENIYIPEEIDEEKVSAEYENGILKVVLPKIRKEEKIKKIEVK